MPSTHLCQTSTVRPYWARPLALLCKQLTEEVLRILTEFREHDAHSWRVVFDSHNLSDALDRFNIVEDHRELEVDARADRKRLRSTNECARLREVRHVLANKSVKGLELFIDCDALVVALVRVFAHPPVISNLVPPEHSPQRL